MPSRYQKYKATQNSADMALPLGLLAPLAIKAAPHVLKALKYTGSAIKGVGQYAKHNVVPHLAVAGIMHGVDKSLKAKASAKSKSKSKQKKGKSASMSVDSRYRRYASSRDKACGLLGIAGTVAGVAAPHVIKFFKPKARAKPKKASLALSRHQRAKACGFGKLISSAVKKLAGQKSPDMVKSITRSLAALRKPTPGSEATSIAHAPDSTANKAVRAVAGARRAARQVSTADVLKAGAVGAVGAVGTAALINAIKRKKSEAKMSAAGTPIVKAVVKVSNAALPYLLKVAKAAGVAVSSVVGAVGKNAIDVAKQNTWSDLGKTVLVVEGTRRGIMAVREAMKMFTKDPRTPASFSAMPRMPRSIYEVLDDVKAVHKGIAGLPARAARAVGKVAGKVAYHSPAGYITRTVYGKVVPSVHGKILGAVAKSAAKGVEIGSTPQRHLLRLARHAVSQDRDSSGKFAGLRPSRRQRYMAARSVE